MVLAGALLAVLFAVSCKNECAFEPVYKDMLDVVDNPAKMYENMQRVSFPSCGTNRQ